MSENPINAIIPSDGGRRACMQALLALIAAPAPFAVAAQASEALHGGAAAAGSISWQAAELAEFYKALVAKLRSQPDMGIVRTREIYEHWGDIGAEPVSVNYEVTDIDGMFGLWARPQNAPKNRVLLCTHGGGYRVGSPYSHRKMYAHLARQAQAQALIVDYRRVPEATFPAAVVDTTRAYKYLLQKGMPPTDIAIAGDSAGGCLAISTALSIRTEGMPLPSAVLSMSPAIDPYAMGASYESNKDKDFLLSRNLMRNVGKGYLANEADAKHPLATPLNSDLQGMPPLYVQVGGAEVLLDDSLRLADLARAARVDVRLDVYPHMQHVFQMGAGFVPEADEAIAQAGVWLRRQWR